MKRTLHHGWTVRAVGGDIPAELEGRAVPATVPGCVHTDLLAAGLIPDPYLDLHEAAVAWIGRVDWRYETTVDVNTETLAAGRVDLVALGLDTVATVELNGEVAAEAANMHRSYRIPVADRLRPGANRLAVTFAAGEPAALRASEAIGPRLYLSAHPFNAIRKMACNYGWDWGPVLITVGLWRPLLLHAWHAARIAAVRPLVEVDGSTGVVHTHVDLERATEQALTLRVSVGNHVEQLAVPAGATAVVLDVRVPDAALWWPRGYGDQPLYPVAVVLLDAADETTPLDDWSGRIGFRTVTLDIAPDADGTPFTLLVNGVPVFARGVNWIPEDCFPSRITAERYAQRLEQAAAANVNLIRVWGGGIYESENFYDRCDELGLLVWQDFLFACAAYAEEEPLASEVVAEAREAVTRLCPHPSLAVWNGNNENLWGFEDGGWGDELDGQTWGWGYYTDVLPAIVAELDPTRPYSPGCPYSFSPGVHPNDDRHGTAHLWDVWNERDYTAYREHRSRFVSEFGWQGPPTWPTLTRAVHDQPLTPDSPGVLSHQKAADGQGKLRRGLARHLPEPENFDDWHWAMSLNQARAVRVGVEHLRSLHPYCQGAVVWQLNDCWPVTSWAVVDGDGRRKPVWYALRDAFADRLLTIQPRPGGLALVAVNDAPTPWSRTVSVARHAFDGTVLASADLPVDLEPRTGVTVPIPNEVAQAGDPARELLVARQGARRTWWPFAENRDAALPPAELDVEVTAVGDGYRLDVTARTLVVDLAVLADRIAADAEVDAMLITLLPAERTRVHVRTAADLSPSQLLDPRVLRSANQLVARAGKEAATATATAGVPRGSSGPPPS